MKEYSEMRDLSLSLYEMDLITKELYEEQLINISNIEQKYNCEEEYNLSIDCGKNNFGFCIVNDKCDIIDWGNESWEDLKDLVNKLDNFKNIKFVLIEQQQINNPKMYKLMNYLEMYFTSKDITTKIQSAKMKLKPYQREYRELLSKCKKQNKGAEYRTRKKLSIVKCRELINEEWLEFFNDNKKKDDLSDSFLQIHYYLFKD